MNDPKTQAEALATELELHIDDLLDQGYTRDIRPDGRAKVAPLLDGEDNEVGTLLETGDVKDQPNAFYVTLLGGNRFKVTVEHVQAAVGPDMQRLEFLRRRYEETGIMPDLAVEGEE